MYNFATKVIGLGLRAAGVDFYNIVIDNRAAAFKIPSGVRAY
jgi:hypothetical protein